MKIAWALVCIVGVASQAALAQAAGAGSVLRLDAALDALVAADAKLETLYQRESTFEGPNWVRVGKSGYLIFADVPGNAIERLNADGSVSPLLENIYQGKDIADAYESFGLNGQRKFRMLGANGVTLDRRGRVVYCAYSDGQIVRLEHDGRRTVLASQYDGHRINAPNDLVYRSDGALYFTDSRAATRHANGDGIPHKGLYLLKGGKVLLLSQDIDHPNGVALSPDEKYLYVTNSMQKNVLRYEVRPEAIANETVFVDMSGASGAGAPDGVKVDRRGNVYASGPGGIWILSPAGKHLGTIQTPQQVNNFAFGDSDYRALYMTGAGLLYRIRLNSPAR